MVDKIYNIYTYVTDELTGLGCFAVTACTCTQVQAKSSIRLTYHKIGDIVFIERIDGEIAAILDGKEVASIRCVACWDEVIHL